MCEVVVYHFIFPATLPPFLHPLLEACWKQEPDERPLFADIVFAIQTGLFE